MNTLKQDGVPFVIVTTSGKPRVPVCVDAAGDVAEALSELQAAQDDLEELGLGVEALEEAEDDAVLARILAVGDVIELDEAMESDVEANNTAIADLIGLKQAW